MPAVPYSPFATERPDTRGVGQINLPAVGAAFGTEQAQAIKGLGQTLGHAGDELFQRATALQQLQNETEAREGDTQFALQSSQMRADFHSKLGTNAGPQALQEYTEKLKNLREGIRANLKTDMARKMYDS